MREQSAPTERTIEGIAQARTGDEHNPPTSASVLNMCTPL
jgi:hypothetical protein